MTPQLAYEWLTPKLSAGERQALDVVYAAAMVGTEQSFHPIGTLVGIRPLLDK